MSFATINNTMPDYSCPGLSVDNRRLGGPYNYITVSDMARSPYFSNAHKLDILRAFPANVLGALYNEHMTAYHFHLPSTTSSALSIDTENIHEGNYTPLIDIGELAPDPQGPEPVYDAYAAHFMTSHDARAYRKRTRVEPKSHAPDVERVRRYGRQYWVQRLYEAMIDITSITDGDSSIHRQRFTVARIFEQADLEATAHHLFDSALAVHERGWNRPVIYHKKVVRGKLADVSEKSLETRLARICLCLKQKKATVDDAMRGGVTLALLCDNPEARGFTKLSNNTGNKKRGERLRMAKGQKPVLQRVKEE